MSEKHVPAFKEKLVVSEFEKPFQPFDKLHEFEFDKRFIVRKFDTLSLDEGTEVPIEMAPKIFQEALKELESGYGIISPTHLVMAEDENKSPSLFILTERISSIVFDKASSEQKEKMAAGIADIFHSLIKYYEKKYVTGDRYLSDLPDASQYVYGSKRDDSLERWYLVDSDPYFSKDKSTLLEVTETLEDALADVETEFRLDLSDVKAQTKALRKSLFEDLGYGDSHD